MLVNTSEWQEADMRRKTGAVKVSVSAFAIFAPLRAVSASKMPPPWIGRGLTQRHQGRKEEGGISLDPAKSQNANQSSQDNHDEIQEPNWDSFRPESRQIKVNQTNSR